MVSVLTSIVVDHGFEHRSGQARDYEIVFATFKRTKRAVLGAKTGWFGLKTMCPSGAPCLPAEYVVN